MANRNVPFVRILLLTLACGCSSSSSRSTPDSSASAIAATGGSATERAGQTAIDAPLVDHHKHLLSPAAAEFQNSRAAPGGTARRFEATTAQQVLAELDSAGIRRAVVLSIAYWFGRDRDPPVDNEYERVRAENDWGAAQAAQHKDRLIAFCSFNPLRSYALAELDRCAKSGMHGLKLHFGNSRLDVHDTSHVRKAREVFAAANERRLPIVVHLWVAAGAYGASEAKVFLEQILPSAPEIVVQIAHFAGGGPGYTDEALGVYAEAIAAGDKRTRNLYFDVATVADRQSDAALKQLAVRIRQVGLERVLFGSDLATPGGNPSAKASWEHFRTAVPLTADELKRLATNIAPYPR